MAGERRWKEFSWTRVCCSAHRIAMCILVELVLFSFGEGTSGSASISVKETASRLSAVTQSAPSPSSTGQVQHTLQESESWGNWNGWSACTVSCGIGLRMKRRNCLQQACSGNSVATRPCRYPTCSESGGRSQQSAEWGQWSSCSSSCSRSRQKSCTSRNCPSRPERQSEACRDHARCSPRNSWAQWNSWSQCSVSCGQGSRHRRRHCRQGYTCLGAERATESCSQPDCAHWGSWRAKTRCSVTCGGGTRTEERECVGVGRCHGHSERSEACSQPACPTASSGVWGPWSAYRACSVSCGSGVQLSQRRCNVPGRCSGRSRKGRNCGRRCPQTPALTASPKLTTTARLSVLTSPSVDALGADWQMWGLWSACSVTCGIGNEIRTRDCGKRKGCFGHLRETRLCQRDACDKVGWSEWSKWSNCSIACGKGNAVRSRQCVSTFCFGATRQTRICNNGPCANRVNPARPPSAGDGEETISIIDSLDARPPSAGDDQETISIIDSLDDTSPKSIAPSSVAGFFNSSPQVGQSRSSGCQPARQVYLSTVVSAILFLPTLKLALLLLHGCTP